MPIKTLGKFQVVKALGEGANSKVKLVVDPDTNKQYAAKIFKTDAAKNDPNFIKMMQDEVNMMKKINHPCLVNFIDCQTNGVYTKKDGTQRQVIYLVLELAQGGELFDFISQSGPFSEPICRYYFKQMCEALDNIHKNGVCHRDLKPENILLDEHFNIKIADFGFAAPTDGKDHSGYLRTRLGTLNYMSPEIHQRKPYSGPAADVFAASIILFIMLTQHPPFNVAQPDDGFYKCIAANRSDLFWKSHAKTKQQGFFSEDFKKLIQSMMQLDPANRPNFLEVLNHPWMKGPMATQEQVQHEFKKRKEIVDNALYMEKQAAIQQKQQQRGAYRAVEHGKYEREIEFVIEGGTNNTKFYTEVHPDLVQQSIMNVISKNDAKVSLAPNKYKFACCMKGTNKEQSGQQVVSSQSWEQHFQIKIYKMQGEQSNYCIEFQRKGGDQIKYLSVFQELKQKILDEPIEDDNKMDES